jgi:uncharacterized protein YdhG (YjbR/CyaY superfamily)
MFMDASSPKFQTVDEYHAAVPAAARKLLDIMRKTIRQAAPEAEEYIGYNMPAYRLNGPLVYYAAAKTHIGFYPTSTPIIAFATELKDYKTSKGAIQFPLEGGIPTSLIKEIVAFKVAENLAKAEAKRKRK